MLEACLLSTAMLVLRGLWLRLSLGPGDHLIWTRRDGLVRTRLSRRLWLHQQVDGMGGLGPPMPRERRTRLVSVAGVPLWRHVESVGLPIERADRLHSVTVAEFDSAFSDAFRIEAHARLAPPRPGVLAPPSRV